MLGVIVNTAAVIAAGIIGLLFRRGISEKITRAAMLAVGLCTLYIGISGTLEGQNSMVLVISMIFGTVAGTLIDIDDKINRLGQMVSKGFKVTEGGRNSVSEGFVTASLLFCVGSMAIVGSLNSGLSGNNDMLFTKSVLDFISAMMLSVSLGFGVVLSAVSVFVYQGAIVALSGVISPFLTEQMISEINCAGSLIIVALALNLIGISKFKVANFLPALLFVPFVCLIANGLGI